MLQMGHSEGLRRLGDFEIVREIGRGGMGVVYEARQVSLNRQVALKVLSGGLGLTAKAVQRFRREAEAAARLHHTNIVPIYATGEENGTHYYAMELIEGPSLDCVIRQLRQPCNTPAVAGLPASADGLALTGPYITTSGLTQGQAAAPASSAPSSARSYFESVARMIAEVADALDYAHQQGVIHRDIKPSNLLLAPPGRLSLNDFGLARLLEQPGMTLTGEVVGTPVYMSPEQITAGRVPVDQRTDIYSLGATLYEMLTLQLPFIGERRDQVLAQILQKEPKAPRRINKKVPVDLETICLKALDKDPDRRYQTAGAMAEDLRRYLNRFAILARRTGPVGRLVKWVRRRPAVAVSLACAMAAVMAAGFFGFWAHLVDQRRIAEQQRAEEQFRGEQQQHALENALAVALGGDLQETEMAIAEAERLGASTGQVRMLRGLVALYHGDHKQALHHLEQAVQLLPDSVAAVAMLASAYGRNGELDREEQTLERLDQLTPVTPEDYLFKGQAQAGFDPASALQTLDEAVRRWRNSPLARAIRADVRATVAQDYADLREAERAVADARAAQELLPENPYVLNVNVTAELVLANLYGEADLPDKRQAALDEAARAAKALERAALPRSFDARWVYFTQTGAEAAAFEVARQSAEHFPGSFLYVMALFGRGKVSEALQVLDAGKLGHDELEYRFYRIYVLAEAADKGQDQALAAYRELTSRNSVGVGALWNQTILLLLGLEQEAGTASRELLKQGTMKHLPSNYRRFHEQILEYLSGDLSEERLVKAAIPSRSSLCLVHYFIALKHLAGADRVGARQHFREATETHAFLGARYDWSRLFLARLEKDPTWPPWIPMKK